MPITINGTGTVTGLSVGGLPAGTVNSATILDGSILPVDTQVGALPSMVRLNTANGYGSTNTAIPRFTTIVTNQGTDITYADSATLGASFTINTNGVYAIGYTDSFAASNGFAGISLNSSQLTTPIYSITIGDCLCYSTGSSAAAGTFNGTTVYLPSGSVIRPHAVAAQTRQAQNNSFTITRVA